MLLFPFLFQSSARSRTTSRAGPSRRVRVEINGEIRRESNESKGKPGHREPQALLFVDFERARSEFPRDSPCQNGSSIIRFVSAAISSTHYARSQASFFTLLSAPICLHDLLSNTVTSSLRRGRLLPFLSTPLPLLSVPTLGRYAFLPFRNST